MKQPLRRELDWRGPVGPYPNPAVPRVSGASRVWAARSRGPRVLLPCGAGPFSWDEAEFWIHVLVYWDALPAATGHFRDLFACPIRGLLDSYFAVAKSARDWPRFDAARGLWFSEFQKLKGEERRHEARKSKVQAATEELDADPARFIMEQKEVFGKTGNAKRYWEATLAAKAVPEFLERLRRLPAVPLEEEVRDMAARILRKARVRKSLVSRYTRFLIGLRTRLPQIMAAHETWYGEPFPVELAEEITSMWGPHIREAYASGA